MRAEAILACLKNKEFQKSAVCFLGFVGLLWGIIAFSIVPQYKKVHALRTELAQLNIQSRQYGNFDKFQDGITLQRERIVNVLRVVAVDRLVTDKSDQGVFAAMGRIREKADVKQYKISPAETCNGQQVWRVSIKAPYNNIVAFVSLLERSFKINKLRITSGRNVALHSAELIVYPIDVPAPSVEGKDVFTMHAEIAAFLKGLEARLNTDKSDYPEIRDPLFFDYRFSGIKEPAPKEETVSAQQRLPVKVEGIFWQAQTPMVSINGKVCREGETFQDFHIVKIRKQSVDIGWRSRIFTVKPHQETK